jgi:hypothetical protein
MLVSAMPDHLSPEILLTIPSYIATDFWWSVTVAETLTLSYLSPIAVASAVAGLLINRWLARAWDRNTAISVIGAAILGPTIVFLGTLSFDFCVYPIADHLSSRARIAQLGGAPDAAVSVPYFYPAKREKILAAVDSLSELMNGDGKTACGKSTALINSFGPNGRLQGQAAIELSQIDEIIPMTRRLNAQLIGAESTGGMLKGGDQEVMQVLQKAIQPKDNGIIMYFDGYAGSMRMAIVALNAVDQSTERNKLFGIVFDALIDEPLSEWHNYTRRFCELIDKTNDRISDIRYQLKP